MQEEEGKLQYNLYIHLQYIHKVRRQQQKYSSVQGHVIGRKNTNDCVAYFSSIFYKDNRNVTGKLAHSTETTTIVSALRT